MRKALIISASGLFQLSPTTFVESTDNAAFTNVSNTFASGQGIRAALGTNANGLYVPWIAGDTYHTVRVGSADPSNNQHAIYSTSYYGAALRADTYLYHAVEAWSYSAYPAIRSVRQTTSLNTSSRLLDLDAYSLSNPLAGFGGNIEFHMKASGVFADAGSMGFAWNDPSFANRSSYFTIATVTNAGAITERARITPSGALWVGKTSGGITTAGAIDAAGTIRGLSVIARGAVAKATAASSNTPLEISSNDDTNPLRMTFNTATDTTLASRYTYIESVDGATKMPLALAPFGGSVWVGLSTSTYTGNGDVDIGGSARIGRGTNAGGSLQIVGTTNISHFNYSTAEDTYIRGGKATSKVYINDTVSGNVLLAVGGGAVGVGTSTPLNNLQVGNGIGLRFVNADNMGVMYNVSNDGVNWVRTAVGGVVLLHKDTGAWRVYTATTSTAGSVAALSERLAVGLGGGMWLGSGWGVSASTNVVTYGGTGSGVNIGSIAFGDGTGYQYIIGTTVSSAFVGRFVFKDNGTLSIGTGYASSRTLTLDNGTNTYLSWNVAGVEKWVAGLENANSNRWVLYNGVAGTYPLIIDSNNRLTINNDTGIGASPDTIMRLLVHSNTSTSGTYAIYTRDNNSTLTFYVRGDGAGYLKAASWTYGSDYRMKRNIAPMKRGSEVVKAINPTSFRYIDSEATHFGFIAQDIQPYLPELVVEGTDGMLGLMTTELIPVLWNTAQEHEARLDILETKLKALEHKSNDRTN